MENAFKNSLLALFEQAPLGIAIFRKGKARFLNRMAMKIWGIRDASQAIGKPFEYFIAPSCREAVSRMYNDRLKGLNVLPTYESVGIRPDGTEFHYHVDVALVELDDGPATVHFFRDISARRQIEETLKENLERLSLALRGSGDISFDLDCRSGVAVTSRSETWNLGLDWSQGGLRLESLTEFIHPEDKASVMQALRDHFDGKTDSYETDKRYLLKSGGYKWIRTRGRVCERDGQGRPLRMVGTYTDISPWKQIEDELRSTLEDLERRVMSKNMDLSEANIALQVLLDHMEKDRREVEKHIAAKVTDRIIPHINKLKADGLSKDQRATLALLEEDLNQIVSPFLKHFQGRYPGFTPQEIQVADRIRMNQSSKEIARQMNISANTVDLIRYRIRKKLNINKKKIHLGAYLSSI
jgi:PAS domain S-box-containing protein